MRVANSGPQVTAGDDVRVTPVGKFLRKTKLEVLWHTIIAVAFPNKTPVPTLEEIQSYTIRHRR